MTYYFMNAKASEVLSRATRRAVSRAKLTISEERTSDGIKIKASMRPPMGLVKRAARGLAQRKCVIVLKEGE